MSASPTSATSNTRSGRRSTSAAITLDVGSSLANKTGSWRTVRPMLDVVRRTSGFAEVGNLDEETAVFEARRCMSCGNCYGGRPDNAVIKLGTGSRFKFKYDDCKGRGICVSECPCGHPHHDIAVDAITSA